MGERENIAVELNEKVSLEAWRFFWVQRGTGCIDCKFVYSFIHVIHGCSHSSYNL